MPRTKLSRLATQLRARSVTLCRSTQLPGFVELRVLRSTQTERTQDIVIAQILIVDLFDSDGNHFEDDLR